MYIKLELQIYVFLSRLQLMCFVFNVFIVEIEVFCFIL
jgi:hypothetical protein